MYRVKQLFGGSLTLRDYDGQVAEALGMVRALNKITVNTDRILTHPAKVKLTHPL